MSANSTGCAVYQAHPVELHERSASSASSCANVFAASHFRQLDRVPQRPSTQVEIVPEVIVRLEFLGVRSLQGPQFHGLPLAHPLFQIIPMVVVRPQL